MQLRSLYELHSKMDQENILYALRDTFTSDMLTELRIKIKNDLKDLDIEKKTMKQTYRVLVESLQNMHRHAAKDYNGKTEFESIFILVREDGFFKIYHGNAVQNSEIIGIKSKINEVNGMSREQLKERKRELVMASELSLKGGAGTGLIEIALNSGYQLSYDFTKVRDIGEDCSFFSMEILIKEQ